MARRFAARQPTPVQEADSAAFAMYADISEIVAGLPLNFLPCLAAPCPHQDRLADEDHPAGGTPHSQLPRAHAATPVVHPSFFQEYADITVR